MSFRRTFCSALAGLLLLAAVPAGAADFVGNWYNVDPNSAGVTRIVVRQRPDGLEINPFGRCHPNECDWGWRPARAYMTQPGGNETVALMVRFDFGRASDSIGKIVTLRFERDLLRMETFTVFGDERRPYWMAEFFQNREPRTSTPVPATPLH